MADTHAGSTGGRVGSVAFWSRGLVTRRDASDYHRSFSPSDAEFSIVNDGDQTPSSTTSDIQVLPDIKTIDLGICKFIFLLIISHHENAPALQNCHST